MGRFTRLFFTCKTVTSILYFENNLRNGNKRKLVLPLTAESYSTDHCDELNCLILHMENIMTIRFSTFLTTSSLPPEENAPTPQPFSLS